MNMLFAAILGLLPVQTDAVRGSADCSATGIYRPIAVDTGAGTTWRPVTGTQWCDLVNGTINPVDDPTFATLD
jgi:hypothetical protein